MEWAADLTAVALASRVINIEATAGLSAHKVVNMTKQEAIEEQLVLINQLKALVDQIDKFSRKHDLHWRMNSSAEYGSIYSHGDWSESDWESSAPDC